MLTLIVAVSAFSALVALYVAGGIASDLIRARRSSRDRIARAVRPVHGGPVIKPAPRRFHNRPGED